jgi:hypothetical protein
MEGIATLPQEFPQGRKVLAPTARWPLYPWVTYQENLQTFARNVPCVHSMFIEVSIVPVQHKPFRSGKAQ